MANAEKVAAVAELTERFRGSSGAVLTEYRGLTVAQLVAPGRLKLRVLNLSTESVPLNLPKTAGCRHP